jgi:hypothetical protein
MQWSVPLTRGTAAAYAPAAPRVAVRSLRSFGSKSEKNELASLHSVRRYRRGTSRDHPGDTDPANQSIYCAQTKSESS